MRINFNNINQFKKNAKRIQAILNQLEINDHMFNQALASMKLSGIQNALAKSYGYNNYSELQSSLSSQAPQLTDIKNEDSLTLEKSIRDNLGEYFSELGIPKHLAYSIGAGLPEHLRRQLDKKTKAIPRTRSYQTYKKSAKEYGMTIPAFKKVLSSNGALKGTVPSLQALKNDWAIVSIMVSESYGTKLKILWAEDYVKRSFSRKGVKVNSPYQKYERPSNLADADRCLDELGNSFVEIIYGPEKKHNDCYCFDLYMHGYLYFLLLQGNKTCIDVRASIMSKFEWHIEKANEINPTETSLILESLDKTIKWAENY